MGIHPPSLKRLIDQLGRLPGVGPKSATRMALHILRSERELAENLARSLLEVKDKIRFCTVCCNITDEDPCPLCRDPSRANGVLCVVETAGDLLALEQSGGFRGRYHVLHGVLSPLDGIGAQDLRIQELMPRIQAEGIREVILATNPTTEGEATAAFVAKLLAERHPHLRVTRIALGVPMGADVKYMDRMTLSHALRSRVVISRTGGDAARAMQGGDGSEETG